MATREVQSFCRVCHVMCGTRLTIDEDDRILKIEGDPNHPASDGYICYKGVHANEAHQGASRLKHSLKRMPDGSFVPIPAAQAIDEIADKLRVILDRDGPEAIAGYMGGGGFFNKATHRMVQDWLLSIGSPNYFASTTIDQPAKFVTPLRLGVWLGGKKALDECDVVMIYGTNPLVSHTAIGYLVADPTKLLKKAKARGMKLIVVDPRYTETAKHADIFLQPYPGEDPTVLSGLLRVILTHGWEDKDFCARFVAPGGIDNLRRAVDPFTPGYVARRAGVPADKLIAAARMFAHECHDGGAVNSTGPSMAPRGNLMDHLMECLNVICGRFRRAGEQYRDIAPWDAIMPRYEEVMAPSRPWESQPPSRIRGAFSLWGERMSATLADEILTPGKGQIKALMVNGGAPATTFPDQRKTVKALKALELLVSFDPFMTTTAKLSHYVIAPKMPYERPDLPITLNGVSFVPKPWGQYTAAVVKPPPDAEVVNDWYVYWGISRRLGIRLNFAGVPLDTTTPPTTDDLLAIIARNGAVPLEEIKKHEGGALFGEIAQRVLPGRPEATGRFDVMPDDIATELVTVAKETVEHGHYISQGKVFSHRLSVRRLRKVWNSMVPHMKSTLDPHPYNPAWMHPDDIAANGLKSGDRVEIVSDFGRIPAIVESDETVRPGVVSISHGFGGLPDEEPAYESGGSCTNLLISTETDVEPITAMVRMSAIPINIVRL